MNKKMIVGIGLSLTLLSSCGMPMGGTSSQGSQVGNVLGGVLGAITNGDALGNVLGSIIGLDKPTEAQLYGTWQYAQPGVAFTSQNALAKAGGEIAASQIKGKLIPEYQKVGISSSNTVIVLNQDKTFSAKIAGMPLSGTYTYNPQTCLLSLNSLLLKVNCYVKGTTKGMSFLMESKKLLTLLQTAASISGNSSLQTIGSLSTNFDGVQIGFDMSR